MKHAVFSAVARVTAPSRLWSYQVAMQDGSDFPRARPNCYLRVYFARFTLLSLGA